MKTLSILLLILGTGILVGSRSTPNSLTTEISVLRDLTDAHLAQPSATDIFHLYDFTTDSKWDGATFRFADLSDVSYNKIAQAKLISAKQWLSNELERDKEIKKFKDEVEKILIDSAKEKTGREHSSVYIPIARELIHLSQNNSQKKILLVFSDLMENDDVSLYREKEFQLMKSNPDSLKKLFQSWQALSTLSGVEVHFIFQPDDSVKDARYKIVSDFYRSLLENKGAKVFIEANIQN